MDFYGHLFHMHGCIANIVKNNAYKMMNAHIHINIGKSKPLLKIEIPLSEILNLGDGIHAVFLAGLWLIIDKVNTHFSLF